MGAKKRESERENEGGLRRGSHISELIHARVLGSRVDVVTLCDEMVRVARFSCCFFTVMAGNKVEKKNQGSSMYFYALISWKRCVFQGRQFL